MLGKQYTGTVYTYYFMESEHNWDISITVHVFSHPIHLPAKLIFVDNEEQKLILHISYLGHLNPLIIECI